MPKKVNAAANIQVQARMTGYIQWGCPSCGNLHGTTRVKWRKAQVACGHCYKIYRLGLGFSSTIGTLPPYNALFCGKFNNFTTNRLENTPEGASLAVGRCMSTVDWQCPRCTASQVGSVGWDLGDLTCVVCESTFYLRLLIWKSTQHHPIGTPYDWTPLQRGFGNKRIEHEITGCPDDTIPVTPVSESNGETS